MFFVGFHTEGFPHDLGINLSVSAAEVPVRLADYFEKFFIFNKRTLKALPGSEMFCNENPEPLIKNMCANSIGYFDFKPFLIDHVLDSIPRNALLMYHDMNFERYVDYWNTDWPNLTANATRLLNENKSDVFAAYEWYGTLVKQFVKTHTIDKLFPGFIENHVVRNCGLINASKIILRNTPAARQFVRDWMSLVLCKEFVAPSPNPAPDPAFEWSCGDQDVFNCLVYRYVLKKRLPASFPLYGFRGRVIKMTGCDRVFQFRNLELERLVQCL